MSKRKIKAASKFPGRVEKVIHSQPHTGEPEKAQISVEGADHLYKEIRVPNRLVDGSGQNVKLKQGEEVDVTIETESTGSTEAKSTEAKNDKA